MKFDKKTLTEMWKANMITDNGKDKLIGMLLGEIKDYQERIITATKEKGLHKQ